MHSRTFENINNIAREELRNLLVKCTPEQINLFKKMYISVNDIDADKIDWAMSQIERTLDKNER